MFLDWGIDMKKVFFLTILFLVLLFQTTSFAEWTQKSYMTRFGTSDQPIPIRWAIDSAKYYQVFVWFTYYNTRNQNVTYEIYDDTSVVYTEVIDQRDESLGGRWLQLGWMHPIYSGNIKVKVICNGTDSVSADAVKITNNACVSDGVIIDNGDAGTSSNGSWDVSSAIGAYGTDSIYGNANGEDYTWETTVTPTVVGYYCEYYLQHVEQSVSLPIQNIGDTFNLDLQLPKSGHYIINLRAARSFSQTEIDSLQFMDVTQLTEFVTTWGCDVVVTPQMTEQEIIAAIITSGSKGAWGNPTLPESSYNDNCDHEPWWIYTHVAPVGQIIIN